MLALGQAEAGMHMCACTHTHTRVHTRSHSHTPALPDSAGLSSGGSLGPRGPCQTPAQNVGTPAAAAVSRPGRPRPAGWQPARPPSAGPLPVLTPRRDNSSPGFFFRPPSGSATTALFFILLIESFVSLKGETLSGFMCQAREGIFNDTSNACSFERLSI